MESVGIKKCCLTCENLIIFANDKKSIVKCDNKYYIHSVLKKECHNKDYNGDNLIEEFDEYILNKGLIDDKKITYNT